MASLRSHQRAEYGHGTGIAHPVDVHVGERVRGHRRLAGMNQAALGDRLGISFQQLQKYERGQNRLSASLLKEIADTFGVPISSFFAGLGSDPTDDHLMRAETLKLIRFYYAMPEEARSPFLEVVKATAKLCALR